MDDSTPSTEHQPTQRIPLGMSSFGNDEQQQLGQNIRLAMACMEGTAEPVNVKAMPSNTTDIRQRLKVLSQDITSSLAIKSNCWSGSMICKVGNPVAPVTAPHG